MNKELERIHDGLKKLRENKDLSLRPTPHLVEEFLGQDGTMRPFCLRYYQVQGVLHLLTMKRCFRRVVKLEEIVQRLSC